MKAVAEIVAAIILLASGGYLAPKAVESFKKETLMKVDKGTPPLQNFSQQLQKWQIKSIQMAKSHEDAKKINQFIASSATA